MKRARQEETRRARAVRRHRAGILRAGGGAARRSRKRTAASCARSSPRTRRSCARCERKYGVAAALGYDQYDDYLRSGEVDAVYVALPNDKHADYTIRAARAGVHVLCEKPIATNSADAERDAARPARDNGVKLMIAYRLHFEGATLEAIERVRARRHRAPAVLLVHVRDAGQGGQHPHPARARRRPAAGPRDLLRERGARVVPRRADRGVRDEREHARRSALQGDRRTGHRHAPISWRSAGPAHVQLRRPRSLRARGHRREGAHPHGSGLRIRERPHRRDGNHRQEAAAQDVPEARPDRRRADRVRPLHSRGARARAVGRGRAGGPATSWKLFSARPRPAASSRSSGSRAARGRPRRRASVASRTGCPNWFTRSRPDAIDAP